ncbi:hypothetical protein BD410DRAFT_792632 [Rickenella mellea]|uniref:Uncharacterized protein n=1 Tax=Rickenella mellea TaxID=50990 RepID=A0A4Y7PVE5_9AGAM|nr:hypothetical protein BD410DRAFT_792632 [Rickenella mellea]
MESRKGKFARYDSVLRSVSARTGTALPSLVFSFAILHEVTALVPLAGFFLLSRSFGVGERVVQYVQSADRDEPSWMIRKSQHWIDEGEQWASRVGTRYGILGFQKGDQRLESRSSGISGRIAGDVANAVVAYGMTKALLPVRIGASLYLAPSFSRRIVDPVTASLKYLFTRGRSRSKPW